jgi:hypothetical protein
MWWKEPKVRTHFYIVEGDVWCTTLGILDKKHLQAYIMTLLTLQIFQQLFPFTKWHVEMSMQDPLSISKVMKIVLYKLEHEFLIKWMQICTMLEDQ